MVSNRNEVEIVVTGETKDAEKNLRGLQGTFKKFEGQIKATGRAMTAFGVVTVGLAAITVKFASDLNESINAVNVVFGDASKTILDFGETASKSAGLANAEFLTLATQTGSLLQNFGFQAQEAADRTTILAQRAADMASVFNTDVKDALFAINAALRGETEPIRRFAIDVTDATLQIEALAQGIEKSVTEMSISEKVTLRLDAIMRQSSKTQGDFENTSNDLANSMRILKADLTNFAASIGQTFIPIVEGMLQKIRPVLDSIIEWTEAHPELTKFIALTAVAIGGMSLVIGPLLIVLPFLAGGITVLTVAYTGLAAVGFAGIISGIAGIGAAAAAAVGPIALLAAALITLPSIFRTASAFLTPDLARDILDKDALKQFKEGGLTFSNIFPVLLADIKGSLVGFTDKILPDFGASAKDAFEAATKAGEEFAATIAGAAGGGGAGDTPRGILGDIAAAVTGGLDPAALLPDDFTVRSRMFWAKIAENRVRIAKESAAKAFVSFGDFIRSSLRILSEAAEKEKQILVENLRFQLGIRKQHWESVLTEQRRQSDLQIAEERRKFEELNRVVASRGGPMADPLDNPAGRALRELVERIQAAGGVLRQASTGNIISAAEAGFTGGSQPFPGINVFLDGKQLDSSSGERALQGGGG